jgi:hypothetical protein
MGGEDAEGDPLRLDELIQRNGPCMLLRY